MRSEGRLGFSSPKYSPLRSTQRLGISASPSTSTHLTPGGRVARIGSHDPRSLCRRCRCHQRRGGGADAHEGHLGRSEEHTSELQSRPHLVCRLLLEKKKKEQYE